MPTSLKRLTDIAQKTSRLIVGLMSGTSLDGLDVALCRISGSGLNTKAEVLAFETFAYPPEIANLLEAVCFKPQVDLEKLCLLNAELGRLHGKLVKQFLQKNKVDKEAVDAIASHGQTVYHSPKKLRTEDSFGNATLQLGDADQISTETGIVTLSDFRQKNIAEGKEGAPLAVYGDYLLFRSAEENRVLLNIGGIANFTLLPKNSSFQNVLSTDTGPGNTLMNQYVRANFANQSFDKDATLALQGKIDEALLSTLLQHPFFTQPTPKTVGPELFNLHYLGDAIQKIGRNTISKTDILATLNRFTAEGIAKAINQNVDGHSSIFVSGGGVHNPLLMQNLQSLLPNFSFKNFRALGFNPDTKEALLFALLANETLAGDPSVFGEATLSMGKISLPD
ncbi:anhydro-N-acetylmuramic acid kinase [Pelobium manganitolerans]|uniref:Anhydro-N-acetylmuramic acid kinase n=1 Tax=Pelobium manganitolerans TaxID=1842495 RepID=A0A419SBK8_9SPHI|nr:anhydro-N-acetylmuramic acid kinase [Pelobium manganitolerans]RKD20177.1 anhydro-N-acetylmuramic acid kinase [Pelobium manganitolerans]